MHTELKPGIDWVGYIDWGVRDFHSFHTKHGVTYNSYLIQDEKVALIDAVKGPFAVQLLQNIRERVPLDQVDYVICNHAEPDHTGCMPAIMNALSNATLVCNAKCREILAGYFNVLPWKIKIINPDKALPLGNRSLHFLDTPMVHWPESMMTYSPQDKVLFSMDAFGQHFASSVRFDSQWNLHEIMFEAKSYYANIVTPYGREVLETLDAAAKLNIEMIATSHGLIWRSNISKIMNAYRNWASGKCEPKILILFDTMWESTSLMADAILSGAYSVSQDINVQILHARRNTLTRIATEMLDTAAVAFGSATLNGQMMPMMASALTYLKGLYCSSPKRAAFAFGSGGWSTTGGVEQIARWFEEMQWKQVVGKLHAQWRPTSEYHNACFEAGKRLASKAIEIASGK